MKNFYPYIPFIVLAILTGCVCFNKIELSPRTNVETRDDIKVDARLRDSTIEASPRIESATPRATR